MQASASWAYEIPDTLPALTGAGPALDATQPAESGVRATPVVLRAVPTDWVGTQLDHFEVERPLARGGMGAVFVARDTSLDRTVAIKLMLDECCDRPELHERFVREARAQAKLNSPHVAQIYYVGRTRARHNRAVLFLAIEYVDGGTLQDVLDRGEVLSAERARALMLQVTRGLLDAEAQGVIHRDIKPANLLLDSAGTVKIADFGVAKVLREADSSITRDGAVVGSPLYMAPEQALGEAVDHRADMYALGCTFYHLLTGRAPFHGSSPVSIIARHLTHEPISVTELAPDLPAQLATIIARLMKKRPEERYASYRELLAALEGAAPDASQHGGFWARGAAAAIDIAIAGGAIALCGWIGLALHLACVTLAQAISGQTIGKYLLNLRVQRTDGRSLGLARSIARTITSMWLPFLVGSMILLTEGRGQLKAIVERMQPSELAAFQTVLTALVIGNALLTLLYMAGLVLAAFHPLKRAAHDLVVGTQVVYRIR